MNGLKDLDLRFKDLLGVFYQLEVYEELNIIRTLEDVEVYANKEIPIPPKELLSSNPLKF